MATTEKDIIKEYPKTKEIADLIVGLGNKLKVDPMYLARTMNAETGGTFSPSKRNTAGSGATGLIQFTKETARNLGTTTQALSKMSAREQMSFVERYFSSIGAGNLARLRNGSQHDVNMAIFYPRAIGKGFNFNIAEDIRRTQSRGAANRFMKQNKGIKKAGDYTMKLTPPLPKLKPSENKKAIKIIEKSKEKELSSEEKNFLKDVERQDPRSFMDVIKNLFIRDAGASSLEEQTDKMLGLSREEKRKAAETSDDPLSDAMGPRLITQQKSSPVDPAALRKELEFFGRDKKDDNNRSRLVNQLATSVSNAKPTIQDALYRVPVEETNSKPKYAIVDAVDEGKELAEFPERDDTKSLDYPTPTDAELDQKDMDLAQPLNFVRAKSGSSGFSEDPDGRKLYGKNPLDFELSRRNTEFSLDEAVNEREDMDVGGEADPRDEDDDVIGDFTFIKDLFRGGFDTGRDSESELNIGADYFYDDPTDVGGEADPRDERDDVIINFNEGGEVKADFDGKDDEDEDEGDPPPLAKPEEVADDIPALLSEGEYVLPANVVRYIGLERIMDMHRQVLSEIQQMEDLGMIQNVDKNGEPEDDDDEMKFAEGEEPEEGVTKGTIIIASAKPKGMMCPEPLRFNEGGVGGEAGSDDDDTSDDPTDTGTPDAGQDDEDDEDDNVPGVTDYTGEPDYSGGITETERGITEKEKAEGDETTEDVGVGDYGGYSGVQGFMAKVMSTKPFSSIPGIADPQSNIDREEAEKDASQPGDADFEIKEEEIKQDKVDDVISDLITKNVYIEGVGYVPLASLMSPRNDVTV